MSSLPTIKTFLRKRGEKVKRWRAEELEFPGVQVGDILWNPACTGEFSLMAVFYVDSRGKLVAHKLHYHLYDGKMMTEIPVCVSDCIADPVDFYSELEYRLREDGGISVIHIRPEHPVLKEVTEGRTISLDRRIWWNFEFWEYIIFSPDFSESDILTSFTPDIMLG